MFLNYFFPEGVVKGRGYFPVNNLALSVKSYGFASSPKGGALGIAAKFPIELQSVQFRQRLSL